MASEISFKLVLHARPEARSLRKIGPVTRTFIVKVTSGCTFARISHVIGRDILPHDPPSSWTMWVEAGNYRLEPTDTWNEVPVPADQRVLHIMV